MVTVLLVIFLLSFGIFFGHQHNIVHEVGHPFFRIAERFFVFHYSPGNYLNSYI